VEAKGKCDDEIGLFRVDHVIVEKSEQGWLEPLLGISGGSDDAEALTAPP